MLDSAWCGVAASLAEMTNARLKLANILLYCCPRTAGRRSKFDRHAPVDLAAKRAVPYAGVFMGSKG